MTSLTSTKEWRALAAHYKDLESHDAAEFFRMDPARFRKFSLRLPGLLLDYSKNLLTDDTLKLLLALAKRQGVEELRDAMFAGKPVNVTEQRPVLHTALRATNAPAEVQAALASLKKFSDAVRSGAWRGYNGKQITDIVSIGIGGSSLGPQLVTEALAAFHAPDLRAHFVANIKASDLDGVLRQVSPETTLFVIASKTFTTAETRQNAEGARAWFRDKTGNAAAEQHFVAMTAHAAAARDFGIAPDNIFPFWDWVGGRFSVWSAAGLAALLMVGFDNFRRFLDGAAAMDAHFKSAPLDQNMPVLLALVGIWHRNFGRSPAMAVAPYHAALRRFHAWLQQIDMESNGKSVDRDGKKTTYATGPVVFGEPGTDAQHSFFQWLHQGTTPVPVDLIGVIKPSSGTQDRHRALLANLIAQGEALMTGAPNMFEPHRHFSGNRPVNTILLDELSPYHLGMLMALYEHKVFVQGAVWNINSFDQFGVELGKTMAKKIQQDLATGAAADHDSSTAGLIGYIKEAMSS